MGKFRPISTELWPLIDVKKFFSTLYLEHLVTIFFYVCIVVHISKVLFGVVYW